MRKTLALFFRQPPRQLNHARYDALNRLTEKTYPDSTTVVYTHDLAGKITEVIDPTGTYNFSYDNMGRLTGTSTAYSFLSGTLTNAYTYDAASNRTGFTAPDSSTNTYSYDTLNRLTTLANSWAGSFGFSYDDLSRRTQMTRPNSVTTNYSYDNLSHLLSVLHQLSGSTIDGASYTLDSAGNRTAKRDDYASVTSDYSYDSIYELTHVTQGGSTTESYSYDAVGNRTASLGVSSYTNNSSNELTASSTTSYSYDYNGNTTSKTVSGGTTDYSWDYENRLASVALPSSGGTVTFKYDPFGRRIEKVSPSATSIFVYDGGDLIETVNASGSVVAHYAQGQNIDEPLAMERGTTNDYYEADGLGSITSMSDASGTLVQTYTYDSFGITTNSSGSLANFFRHAGRELDTETGLYFLKARYYDPALGRFLNEDPLETSGGDVNFYNYVGNSPTDFIDPSGLQRVSSPRTGPPNSIGRFYPDPDDPNVVTVRVYGPNGEATTDYDYGDPHDGVGDPHAHDWGKDKNGRPIRGPHRNIKPGENVPPKDCPSASQNTPKAALPTTPRLYPGINCVPGLTCHVAEDGRYYPGAYPMVPPTTPLGSVPAVSWPSLAPIRIPTPVPAY